MWPIAMPTRASFSPPAQSIITVTLTALKAVKNMVAGHNRYPINGLNTAQRLQDMTFMVSSSNH
jgi:hypothetical protein